MGCSAFSSLLHTMNQLYPAHPPQSTRKDRWRQVLAEADRIDHKHLLTLETSISIHQTDEMQAKNLQLVLPRGLHETYTPAQQKWLMDISSFAAMVHTRQVASENTQNPQ